MTRRHAAAGWAVVVAWCCCFSSVGLAAQEETAASDSVSQIRSVPMEPPGVPTGPLPHGSRITFTRDSLLWTGALTLADVLTEVPGVYVARGGFVGQPELVNYAGRGPAAIEVFWDGFPMHAMGDDSVWVDPGQIPLSYLSRIDVEVLPAGLRVYLVSERHDSVTPRSNLRVTSGAFSTAQYTGLFQKRWPMGLGLNLAGDFVGSEGAPASGRKDQSLEIWGKAVWLPTPRAGVSYQVRRHDQDREPFPESEVGAPAERFGLRTDQMFRLFASSRDDGLGAAVEIGLASSSWSDSVGLEQEVRQGFATARYTRPNLSGEITGRAGDARMRAGAEARVGWVPLRGIVLSAQGGAQQYDGDRSSTYGGVSGGLTLGPFSVTGSVMRRDGVQAPARLDDSAQVTTDAVATFAVDLPFLSGHVSWARRDAFLPLASTEYPAIMALDSTRATDYVLAGVSFRPGGPWRINGLFANPREFIADLQPPQHARLDLTYRSKFWRTFRSGAFDIMLRYGLELWSTGSAGLDADGQAIVLPGATFHDAFLQIQLVDFAIFWNLRNARNSQGGYVPNRTYPRNAQTFGVRWTFAQ